MGGGSRNGRSASVTRTPHTENSLSPIFHCSASFRPSATFHFEGVSQLGDAPPPYVGGGGGGLWNVECGWILLLLMEVTPI